MTVYEIIKAEIQRLLHVRLPVSEEEACEAIRVTIINLQAVMEAFDEEAKRLENEKPGQSESSGEVKEDV